VLGDPVYGETRYQGWTIPREAKEVLRRLKGQALHAERLGFEHPVTGERKSFTSAPPDDFNAAAAILRALAEKKEDGA